MRAAAAQVAKPLIEITGEIEIRGGGESFVNTFQFANARRVENTHIFAKMAIGYDIALTVNESKSIRIDSATLS